MRKLYIAKLGGYIWVSRCPQNAAEALIEELEECAEYDILEGGQAISVYEAIKEGDLNEDAIDYLIDEGTIHPYDDEDEWNGERIFKGQLVGKATVAVTRTYGMSRFTKV